jgi:hypothetical protein
MRRLLVFHSSGRSLAALLCVLAIAAVATTGPLAPVAAQAPDPKDQCKNGGFANFVDPSTGQPFKNQGQCVSHVSRGGTLVPVVTPTPTPTPAPVAKPDLIPLTDCENSAAHHGWQRRCWLDVRNIGAGPATFATNAAVVQGTYSVDPANPGIGCGHQGNEYPFWIGNPRTQDDQHCTFTFIVLEPFTIAAGQTVRVGMVTASNNPVSQGCTSPCPPPVLVARADPLGVIQESNEQNNELTAPTPVPTPLPPPNLQAVVSCQSDVGPQGPQDVCKTIVANIGQGEVFLPAGTFLLWSSVHWGAPHGPFTLLSVSLDAPTGYTMTGPSTPFCGVLSDGSGLACTQRTDLVVTTDQLLAPGVQLAIVYTYQGTAGFTAFADPNRSIENETDESDNLVTFGPF